MSIIHKQSIKLNIVMKSTRGKIRNYDPVICEKFVRCSVNYIWAFMITYK